MSRDFSSIGRALAAPARSVFLGLLMDGSSRPVSELAAAASVSVSTASEHLAVLVEAGLVIGSREGRQRKYRITDPDVAAALEQLGNLCPPLPISGLRQSRRARELGAARLCYDHLAGRLGVAVTDALVDTGSLTPDLVLTNDGDTTLTAMGVDVAAARAGRRPLTRSCQDWTERRPHLAGALGAAVAHRMIGQGWVLRRDGSRGLVVTDTGRRELSTRWGIDAAPTPD